MSVKIVYSVNQKSINTQIKYYCQLAISTIRDRKSDCSICRKHAVKDPTPSKPDSLVKSVHLQLSMFPDITINQFSKPFCLSPFLQFDLIQRTTAKQILQTTEQGPRKINEDNRRGVRCLKLSKQPFQTKQERREGSVFGCQATRMARILTPLTGLLSYGNSAPLQTSPTHTISSCAPFSRCPRGTVNGVFRKSFHKSTSVCSPIVELGNASGDAFRRTGCNRSRLRARESRWEFWRISTVPAV